MRTSAIIFFLALALCSASFGLHAQEPTLTATEKSYLEASKTLESGLQALGGLVNLQAISSVTRDFSAVRTDKGQGVNPLEPTAITRKEKSIRDLRKLRCFDSTAGTLVGGQPFHAERVVSETAVFTANRIDRTVLPSDVSSYPQASAVALRRHPESLLQAALNRKETLRSIGEQNYEGRRQQVISFTDTDGTQLSLYFDAQTHLLTKLEFLRDHAVLGDVVSETIYNDYRPIGKLKLPYEYIDKLGGTILQKSQITSLMLDVPVSDAIFAQPEGFSVLKQGAFTPAIKKLGDGVYALLGLYNSVFVDFNDFVLVVEAGVNSRYTEGIIKQIKATAPGKPLRYLVPTHFHYDHIGGIRSFVLEGTSIITLPQTRKVIEKAARSTRTLRPDALSRAPREPVFEIFNRKRVFDDGVHRIELYDISPNPHVEEMVIAYLPKEKILFEADMLDLDVPEGQPGHAGDDTVALLEKVRQLGLKVELIIPVHGRLGTLADLESTVATRGVTDSSRKN
ncbi:MAG TPA: MBL fold metallo-hydrolase [Pyrinomonadaceae bacterium]|nr:MBL fold metallo-hydrolase [Pyrinomonadaceae bacterium]